MFESTYDRILLEGEVIGFREGYQRGFDWGVEIGKLKSSLHAVIWFLSSMPELADKQIARISKMPEPFVRAFRRHFSSGNSEGAQKIAIKAFSNLEGFDEEKGEEIKAMVNEAFHKTDSGDKLGTSMKIICIGRNYAEHARELNNPVPASPVVFMKPSTAILAGDKPFYIPDFTQDCHHELEIVLKIAKNGKAVLPEFAPGYFAEVTVGIDFTARDVQEELKKKGHPWEIAKAFDNSAVVGKFISRSEALNSPSGVGGSGGGIEFELKKNGSTAQRGNTRDMIFSFEDIIAHVSRYFTLHQGDLIFTGTPAGVGAVKIGDLLEGFIFKKNGEPEQLFSCEIK